MTFDHSVLNLVKKIPAGRVTTYGEIARALGTSPRAVGQALKRNKRPVVVPCHRVVHADGRIGYYSGKGGSRRKAELLRAEGVEIRNGKIDLSVYT